ncbi:dihydrolipoyl dehydrogenase [Haloglomus irregulare]|jgi:dihydrolipoamide dehydrogenase|uniref:Dihydrolipoyl dehydrogenase n=1 Tax=Haloglomus irregulare TaxID=2234134 RepID=A0A554NBX8_9EURY|nr:dihydrolipoyl dehydrogenase [Haloglomus irregulare]TSD14883.1 dihydrolipoyl dehydrogenase [Haloglomus irregulare]
MVVGDISTGTDLLVVGAGPGGYVAAIRAAQQGVDTTLVEADAYGGTCLNEGCIPSKAYITAADTAHGAANAEAMGVHADPAVDMARTRAWKDEVVDTLTGGVEKLCKANGVNLVEGRAEFASERKVRVAHQGEGQGSESVEFEHALIATGSRPVAAPFDFDGEHVLSSTGALALDAVPDRLLVVGAGYIGMELSTTFAKLGADVTVVELLDSALPAYEDDVSRVVRKRAEALGVEFRFGEAAESWQETPTGLRVVTADEDGEETEHAADLILQAVGRDPVTDTMNLEALGLETDEDGFIPTDDQCRTALDHVFAVGDVAGEPMLAHKASAEGEVAADVVAGEPAACDYQAIPAAVFTDPEIATVGMTADEATEAGFEPVVGQMPMNASGRALTLDDPEGFVRVVADGETEFVLGAQIVAPEASELVAEFALAIEMGAQLEDVASTVHTHPTLAEASMEAVMNARGEAVHTLNR